MKEFDPSIGSGQIKKFIDIKIQCPMIECKRFFPFVSFIVLFIIL